MNVSAVIRRLVEGSELDSSDAVALEGIILGEMRPMLPVTHGTIELTSRWANPALREVVERAARSVVRLDVTPPIAGLMFAGTGFLVGDGLVMTSRNVAELFASGLGRENVAFRPGRKVEAVYLALDPTGGCRSLVSQIAMIHPALDVALLRVSDPPLHTLPLFLSTIAAEDLEGREAVLIGHAGLDARRDLRVLSSLLGGVLGGMLASPGLFTEPGIVERLGRSSWAIAHDCSALAGYSGAPVIDVATGRVVGVQSGVELLRNFAIPARELARDARFVDFGATFEGGSELVSPSAWSEDWRMVDGEARSPAETPHSWTQPSESSEIARRTLREKYPTGEELANLCARLGYGRVVDAVPASLSGELYRNGLLDALARRNLLEKVADAALPGDLASPVSPMDEAVVAPSEVGLAEAPAASRIPGEGGPAQDEPVPKPVLDDLLLAVQGYIPRDVWTLSIGSPHAGLLRGGEDEPPRSAAETVARLARDHSSEARRALAWLVGKLLQTTKSTDPTVLERLARADRWLSPPTLDRTESAAFSRDLGVADIAYLSLGAEAARAVVLVRMKAPGRGSSGWLITPSLVVVPAHLLSGMSPGDRGEDATSFEILLDYDHAGAPSVSIGVRGVELIDPGLDLALLRLDAAVHDRAPLRMSTDPPRVGAGLLAVIHHPRLGPKKLSVSTEGFLASDAHAAVYDLHTEAGSGGGPVLDADWRVLATHRAWQLYRTSSDATARRAKTGTTTHALLAAIRDTAGSGTDRRRLWREIVAAQPALKYVAPSLLAKLAEPQPNGSPALAALIIETLDEDTSLGDVPGLQISTRAGTFTTGFGTLATVTALAVRSEVTSVRDSPSAGSVECAVSVPHTGACTIHQSCGEEGDEALVAVIDNGCDVLHRALQDEAGRTRVLAFWDQKDRQAPEAGGRVQAASMSSAGRALVDKFGLIYGTLYVREDLQGIIDGAPPPPTFPTPGSSAHGTAVCSIAAGQCTGASDDHFFGGVAPKAELVVVRYDLQDATVGYSVGHMDALAFIDRLATHLGKPVVVNISNGMNAGAHDGSSDVEVRCEDFTDAGRKPGRVIVKSAGNEKGMGRHAKIKLGQGSVTELRWRSTAVAPDKPSKPEVIELWFDTMNEYSFRLKPPASVFSPPITGSFDEILANGNRAICLLRRYNRENGDGSLHIRIDKGKLSAVEAGEWLLEISAVIVRGRQPIHAWLDQPTNRQLSFRDHLDEEVTITIPGTAPSVITVGAVGVSHVMRPFPEGSIGPDRKGAEKPDLVAPGVALRAARAGSMDGIAPKASPMSGTSFAAPHVTGTIALVLSAQKKKNEGEQLSANQIKSALRRSVRHLSVWNETTGYGELDAGKLFRELGLMD